MRVLLVGYSSIAQRRVLPALAHVDEIQKIDIATSNRSLKAPYSEAKPGNVYYDYVDGIAQSDAELVYISTINSSHERLARLALEKKKHVIVDKPATLSADATEELVQLAEKNSLLFAESTVYLSHARITALRQQLRKLGCSPTHIVSQFSFPALPAENFRWKKEYGGGALWDLGHYAVSPARHFFNYAEPDEVICRPLSFHSEHNVDSSFSVLLTFPSGRVLTGVFGFTTEYTNHIHILGQNCSCELERVFTPPPEMEFTLKVRSNNEFVESVVKANDPFQAFIESTCTAITERDFKGFYQAMLYDARLVQRLRDSAELNYD